MEDYYKLLNVKLEADFESIKKAYSERRKFFDDIVVAAASNPEQRREAQEKLKIIDAAYKVLGDRQKRAEYDEQYRAKQAEEEEAAALAVKQAAAAIEKEKVKEAEAIEAAAMAIKARRMAWAEERAKQAATEEAARQRATAEVEAALAAEAEAKAAAAKAIRARQAAREAELVKQAAAEEAARQQAALAAQERLRREAAAREEQARQQAVLKEALLQEERKKAELETKLRQQAEANAKLQAELAPQNQADSKKNLFLICGGLLAAFVIGFFLFSSNDKDKGKPSPNVVSNTQSSRSSRQQVPVGDASATSRTTIAGHIRGDEVLLRSGPSTGYDRLDVLYNNYPVTILDKYVCNDRYAGVLINPLTVYHNNVKLSFKSGQAVTVVGENGSNVIVDLPYADGRKSVRVKINRRDMRSIYGETWYKVRTSSGVEGYVFADYVRTK